MKMRTATLFAKKCGLVTRFCAQFSFLTLLMNLSLVCFGTVDTQEEVETMEFEGNEITLMLVHKMDEVIVHNLTDDAFTKEKSLSVPGNFALACLSHPTTSFFYEGTNILPILFTRQSSTTKLILLANNPPGNVGKYGCHNTTSRWFVYVFSSVNAPPYLGHHPRGSIMEKEELFVEENIIKIPCKSNNPVKNVYLYKNESKVLSNFGITGVILQWTPLLSSLECGTSSTLVSKGGNATAADAGKISMIFPLHFLVWTGWAWINDSSLRYHPGEGFFVDKNLLETENGTFGQYICTTIRMEGRSTRFPPFDSKMFLISPPKGYRVTPKERKVVLRLWEKISFACETRYPVSFSVKTAENVSISDYREANHLSTANTSLKNIQNLHLRATVLRKYNNITVSCGDIFQWEVVMHKDAVNRSEIHIDLEADRIICSTELDNIRMIAMPCVHSIDCYEQTKCLYLYNLVCIHRTAEAENCADSHKRKSCLELRLTKSHASVLRCFNKEVEKIIQVYTGLDKSRHVTFDGDHVPPNVVMEIQIESNFSYTGMNVECTCTAVQFFCAEELTFGFVYKNGTSVDIITPEIIRADHRGEEYASIITSSLNIDSVDIKQIYCVTLMVNTGKLGNVSADITVEDPMEPIITSKTTEFTFIVGDTNNNLICHSEGSGPLVTTWTKNGENLTNSTNDDGVLQFPVVDTSHEGVYTCTVSNFKGTAMQNFTVRVQEAKSNYKTLAYGLGATGIIGVGLLVISLTRIYVSWKNTKKRLRQLTDAEMKEFQFGCNASMGSGDVEPSALPYNVNFEIQKDTLEFGKEIGSGAYGKVLKGIWVREDQTITVAVKTVNENVDILYFKALLSELKIMCFIGNHVNIVTLLAAYTAEIKDRILYLVMEFCEKGDLGNFLQRHRIDFFAPTETGIMYIEPSCNLDAEEGEKITTSDLYRWALEIAQGMDYLASKKVVHGDLATRNVLLTDENTAKITDFGLSKKLYEDVVYKKKNKVPVPWKWMSVEGLRDNIFSTESDMWSFGVTLWEIFSLAESPYPGEDCNQNFVQNLLAGQRLPCPTHACEKIYNEMLSAWLIEPTERPTFLNMTVVIREIIGADNEENYAIFE